MPRSQVNVFDYDDYRAYLRAFYVAEKSASPTFSYRAFSMRAGLKSPNHLKRIIDGERSLTAAMLDRYITALGLTKTEATYFRSLVQYTESETARERDAAYRRLLGFAQYRRAHQLDAQHADYHGHWYVPAIRELARRRDFRADAAWIARTLRPRIGKAEAEDALTLLLKLGLLRQDESGNVTQTAAVLTTGSQSRAFHLREFHRTMIERAIAAIEEFGPEDRDLSSVTCCVDADAVPILKQLIADFRRECITRAEGSRHPTKVVQINIQLFPLSEGE